MVVNALALHNCRPRSGTYLFFALAAACYILVAIQLDEPELISKPT
jgi:hypothetical protein